MQVLGYVSGGWLNSDSYQNRIQYLQLGTKT